MDASKGPSVRALVEYCKIEVCKPISDINNTLGVQHPISKGDSITYGSESNAFKLPD